MPQRIYICHKKFGPLHRQWKSPANVRIRMLNPGLANDSDGRWRYDRSDHCQAARGQEPSLRSVCFG